MKNFTTLGEATSVATKKWYEEYTKSEEPKKHGKSDMDVIDLKAEAKKCLDSESAAYHLKQSKTQNSEYSWLKTAFTKGTTSDKVAAGIVLVQNSPKHNLNHLSTLISQVKVAKHNQCSMIITALRDLFLNDLLHPGCKLLTFEQQNLDQLDDYDKPFEADESENLKNRPTMSKNKLLAYWYFEDQLKEIYERFVDSLSTIANDTVDTNREKAVTVLNDLLMGNPEQEHKLLDFLVNKLGDPSSKVASKAVFCLTKLLYKHPSMKIVVLREVEKLLFRTNISPRAQYFAICLLTQFILTKEDTEVATTLIDVYFAFFKACLKKGEPDSRMMAAILAGVNRAYPFANLANVKISDHIDSVYKVVHVGSFNVSLNALSLLFQVVGKDPKQSDRFYSAFFRKLFDPQIGTANRRPVFLNLFFRVLRNDTSVVRLHAFIKRILQASINFPANMICATLYTISQILKFRKFTKKILTRSVATIDEKIEIDLNNTMEEPTEVKKKSEKKEEQENTVVLSNVVIEPVVDDDNKEDVKPDIIDIKTEFKVTSYDPFHRNPLRSGANLSVYSELAALAKHFHPSVSLFARTILEGKSIEYTGDPLADLSLIRFLDRYVFKNPKKLESKKVVRSNDPLAQRAAYAPKGARALAVNSEAYLNEREDRIPVDELFLYQYMKKQREKRGAQKKRNDDDDNSSVNSEDFNHMMDHLSQGKNLDDFDLASDFKPNKSKGKNVEDNNDEDSEISDELEESDMEENELDEDDEDVELEDLNDMDLEDIDDDMSDIEFNDDDDDDDEIEMNSPQSSKKRKAEKTVDRNKKMKLSNVFVSAEEFSEMLESQGRSKFKHGASRSFSDRDGASVKQLDWETERNQRIVGFRGNKKGKLSKNFKNKKSFSKQKSVKRKNK